MGLDLTNVLGKVSDVITQKIKYPEGTYLNLLDEDISDEGGYKRVGQIFSFFKKSREVLDPQVGETIDVLTIYENDQNTAQMLDGGFSVVDVVFGDNSKTERYRVKPIRKPEGVTKKWKYKITLEANDKTPWHIS